MVPVAGGRTRTVSLPQDFEFLYLFGNGRTCAAFAGGRRTYRKPLRHKAFRQKSEKMFAAPPFAADRRKIAFFILSEGVWRAIGGRLQQEQTFLKKQHFTLFH